jgi:hypothetical protein
LRNAPLRDGFSANGSPVPGRHQADPVPGNESSGPKDAL